MAILKTFHIFIFIRYCSTKSSPAATYLTVARLGPCRDSKVSEPMTFSEMSLTQKTGATGTFTGGTFSGLINVSRDIANGWDVMSVMEKCHDIRNLDTCDFYKSDTILTNGCVDPNMAEFKNVVFHYTSPKMVCPVKAGTYTINNFPYFTTSLNTAESRISTSVFGYTYSIMGYNDNEERIFCIEAHLRVNYVRKHDWTVNEIKPNNPTHVPTKPGPNEVDQGHPETVEVGADDDDDDDAAPYGVEAREEIDEDVGVEEI